MAQTGYSVLSIYNSSTPSAVPTAGNLVAGELAINTADGRLYYKDSAGVVQVIAGKGGAGVAGGSNTQVQYNSSGSLAGSANMTFSGTALTLANDASISGLTVGKGTGSIATNTVLGNSAFGANTTGSQSIIIGGNAGAANTTGQDNQFIGYYAGRGNTTGSYSVAIGTLALGSASNNSGNNIGIGYYALNATTGGNNTAIGSLALQANTTASNNTAVGYQAGYNQTTGSGNVFLGYQAGNNVTTTSNSMYLGYGTTASSATGLSAEFVIGINNAGKGSNTGFFSPNGGGVYQGNNSSTWSVTSDERLKKNIVDNNTGLDKLLSIQVRNFEYRTFSEITDLPQNQVIEKQGLQLGVIAQELQKVLPECVKQESTGVLTVNSDNLTWYLINAVKELKAEIDQLKGK